MKIIENIVPGCTIQLSLSLNEFKIYMLGFIVDKYYCMFKTSIKGGGGEFIKIMETSIRSWDNFYNLLGEN